MCFERKRSERRHRNVGERERLRRFYAQVQGAGPKRNWIMGGGVVLGLVGGIAGWVEWSLFAGSSVCAVSMGLARMWSNRCGEVLRTGGLRWSHRARGVIEIELLGGARTWRRDLRRVAAASGSVGDDGWRSLEVMMVTAVFPVQWLKSWGFEIRSCTPWTRGVYRMLYGTQWALWSLNAKVGRTMRSRFRRRPCVSARHRMGAWMDVVRGLPEGLR